MFFLDEYTELILLFQFNNIFLYQKEQQSVCLSNTVIMDRGNKALLGITNQSNAARATVRANFHEILIEALV